MSSTGETKSVAPYFFGFIGASFALALSCISKVILVFEAPGLIPCIGFGSAYGTAKAGVGVVSMGVMRPDLVMKSTIPCVMAGMIGIYGLIIAIIISTGIDSKNYSAFRGFAHLGSGLSVGLAGVGSGMAIGIVGDAGVRANSQQPQLFTGMVIVLIFAEALAIYGLIIGLILAIKQ